MQNKDMVIKQLKKELIELRTVRAKDHLIMIIVAVSVGAILNLIL